MSGEWTFDEGAGRAAADTAGGNPIALQDGADWTQDGQSGPAVVFDGTRGYGETGRSVVDPAGNWTVTAWVRLDRVPDGFATAVSEDGGPDSVLALPVRAERALGGRACRATCVRCRRTHRSGGAGPISSASVTPAPAS